MWRLSAGRFNNIYIAYGCANSKIGYYFEGCFCFEFNNLELALGIALKFYTSVVKRLKLYVRKFWRLISKFVGVTVEKLVGEPFCRRPNLFKTFIKVRYTLSAKTSSVKSFRWEKFCHLAYNYSSTKSFSSDIMNIFDLSWECSKGSF